MKIWWWRPNGFTNFGDELGPKILNRLGVETEYVPIEVAEIITVGSVLEHAVRHAKEGCIIWGTGLIEPPKKAYINRLKIAAVRGNRTREWVNQNCAVGDPAILIPQLWPEIPRFKIKHETAWAPHYADSREFKGANTVIDVTQPVDTIIEQIAACQTVVTSSLHVAIVAQQFNCRVIYQTFPQLIGGTYKWEDYKTGEQINILNQRYELLKGLKECGINISEKLT